VKLNEKKKIVQKLGEKFSKSKVVILTDYKGLDVMTLNDLRAKLKEAEVEYKVIKNSLLIRAAEDTNVAPIRDFFKGPSAVAIGYNDPVSPAKILTEFAKKQDKLEIKIGVMDGKVLDLNKIKMLSNLPSREIMLATLLSVINGVPTGFVRTLSAIPTQFLYLLQAIKDQKEAV
jgi:large subunit ribosomal protein L10